MSKTNAISANDFYRWFRAKVRDPLVAATGITDSQKSYVNESLAMELYTRITNIENKNQTATGIQKMNMLISEISPLIAPQGLKALMPVIKIWAEQAVMYIYKTYFLAKFQTMGMNDWLEAFLSVDLDSDGDIGGKPVKKTVAFAETPE